MLPHAYAAADLGEEDAEILPKADAIPPISRDENDAVLACEASEGVRHQRAELLIRLRMQQLRHHPMVVLGSADNERNGRICGLRHDRGIARFKDEDLEELLEKIHEEVRVVCELLREARSA